MQRPIIFFSILVLGCSLIFSFSGCSKKEEPVQVQPSPPAKVIPAPAAAASAAKAATSSDKIRSIHQDFVNDFNAAARQGATMENLKGRIEAAEKAKEACMNIRGTIDTPSDLISLDKFIDALQNYSDKGHAYAASLEEADKMLAKINEDESNLKNLPAAEKPQAISKLNSSKIQYDELYKEKGPLAQQRNELETLGKDLMSMN